jgi:hypothetical protein
MKKKCTSHSILPTYLFIEQNKKAYVANKVQHVAENNDYCQKIIAHIESLF